ncbi:Glutamate receptor [Psidium guajava]|nr:Glutamate receptor [Psidium guajava]
MFDSASERTEHRKRTSENLEMQKANGVLGWRMRHLRGGKKGGAILVRMSWDSDFGRCFVGSGKA